ncbi:EAL domain-containing protein [Sulfurimonas sp.]
MNQYFNSKSLYIIPVVFLIVLLFRILYSYHETQVQVYNFVKKEAQVLNAHAMAHRNYYQKLFLNKTIQLNEKTLPALPAYSSYAISKTFSNNNILNIKIQTVSDRARNPKNKADKSELQAIRFFKNNPKATEYFSDKENEYFQYASALKIEKRCLKCHAEKEKAPLFIQKKYNEAYGYKLGELRGIMSIKIPKDKVNSYFIPQFFYSVFYDFLLLVVLFIIIYMIIKKSKKINAFLEQKIQYKTNELKTTLITDRLTRLPNRLKLIEDLQNKDKYPSKYLALINIDNFKSINDFYGHKTGDKLLKQIAQTIHKQCTGTGTMLYKMPSDEYAIFSVATIKEKDFIKNIYRLINIIQETAYLTDDVNTLYITLSCGIAVNEDDIITKADMALQVAKNDKKNVIRYDDSIDTSKQVNKNIQCITLLKNAIHNDYIQPYFQPIYNIKTKKIEKYEALVRIVLANGEIITPNSFLEISIKSKLYPNITKIMIEKSFAFFQDKSYEFSINLSINDIFNKKTVAFIMQQLEMFPQPQRVVFEILESDKIGDYLDVKSFIKDVKKLGCKIALDDFGSGYSNFSHVLELNVDYLKIDASLVKDIRTNENSKKITQTIIAFAKNIGLKTIAEYVEDEESFIILEEMDIDFIQGYYIGKPAKNLLT